MSCKFAQDFHKCSVEGCNLVFIPYHGKVGNQCHKCDTKTPRHIIDVKVRAGMLKDGK